LALVASGAAVRAQTPLMLENLSDRSTYDLKV
jgi:hypothetical protein